MVLDTVSAPVALIVPATVSVLLGAVTLLIPT